MSGRANCLMVEMLTELKKQTALLERMEAHQALLIQVLAEEQDQDPDAMPMTYMDGSSVT